MSGGRTKSVVGDFESEAGGGLSRLGARGDAQAHEEGVPRRHGQLQRAGQCPREDGGRGRVPRRSYAQLSR